MSEIAELLKRSLLTQGLSLEQTEAIASVGRKENFLATEQLGVIGSPEGDLFVVFEGKVNVLTHDNDKLREVGPNGILGEVSFVDGGPRHAHFVAQGFVSAARFPAKELRAQLSSDRQAGFMVLANLARLLAARLRNADGRLDTLMDSEHDVWHQAL
ncbi:MAG: cyclic nucleotide-binding domain-containing protein [Fimbriimonas sp.]